MKSVNFALQGTLLMREQSVEYKTNEVLKVNKTIALEKPILNVNTNY